MTNQSRKSRFAFAGFITFASLFVVVVIGFLGYQIGTINAANEHCESLGAVAVEATSGYVCVQEVIP